MFNPDALKRNSRRAAFGALALGAMAFSGAASAAPLQLFPFILTPPAPMAQPFAQPFAQPSRPGPARYRPPRPRTKTP